MSLAPKLSNMLATILFQNTCSRKNQTEESDKTVLNFDKAASFLFVTYASDMNDQASIADFHIARAWIQVTAK